MRMSVLYGIGVVERTGHGGGTLFAFCQTAFVTSPSTSKSSTKAAGNTSSVSTTGTWPAPDASSTAGANACPGFSSPTYALFALSAKHAAAHSAAAQTINLRISMPSQSVTARM